MTARGETMPIRWIGRQIFRRGASSRWPDSVHPICVARSALADNVPHTHLYLSPGHALLVDGLLIRAAGLVNGASIIPAAPEGMKDIEYFQIELATHEVIIAEGLPSRRISTHMDESNSRILWSMSGYTGTSQVQPCPMLQNILAIPVVARTSRRFCA